MKPAWARAGVGLLASALLAGAGTSGYSAATEWHVIPDESVIGFEYLQAGQPTSGVFHRFSGEGQFDPLHPGDADLSIRIESASIDLGDAVASAFATSAEWFDSKNYPEIVYRLVRLDPLGGDRYAAYGELTIRGRTRPVVSEITLTIAEHQAEAAGRLDVLRRDYLLGYGPSAVFVDIGPGVTVSFDLVARERGF